MEPQAILLLVVAAIIHSAWNLLSKQSRDKQAFFWLALVAGSVIFLAPFWWIATPVPGAGWPYVLLSAGLEALYFLLLGGAYQRGDLSLVYPLARGSALLFVTLFAFIFLGERAVPLGLGGIALIIAGVYTLHVKAGAPAGPGPGLLAPLLSVRERPSQLALLTGLTIASYSVVDKVGVSYVDPAQYIYLIFLFAALALTPYMLLARRPAVVAVWRANRGAVLAAALGFFASYLLVLFVIRISRVSYVSSVREMSVVFAALLGAFVLHEPLGEKKILGAVLIFAGILCIGLAK